jgi:hypothetical protein
VISLAGGVAPFGDPGITDRSHLPRAFRSVPRPSSPLSAKASTRCPYLALDHRSPRRRRDRTKPPRTGPNPVPANLSPRKRGAGTGSPRKRGPIAAASHEDTSLGHRRRALPAPPRGEGSPPQEGATQRRPGGVRLGHNNSLFTRQSTPRRGRPPRDFWLRRAARPTGLCRWWR